MHRAATLRDGDALLLVDLQKDYLPGGTRSVPGAERILPLCNRYLRAFARAGLPVFLTRTWHLPGHPSFQEQGGPWPAHCVADSEGAALADGLALPHAYAVISAERTRDQDGYSPFPGTDLEKLLRAVSVKRLFVGGLTTDYNVLHTVRDAIARGFEVILLRDATCAANNSPADGARAVAEMCRLGVIASNADDLLRWRPTSTPLLTDFYQLTMLRGCFAADMEEEAVFEFFVRKLPPGWNFLVAAGLEQVLDYLEDLTFTEEHLAELCDLGFDSTTLDCLKGLRFTGDVHAMPEGTVFFPDEPVLRVTAPLPQAQLVETRLVNLLHFQTLIASKAARCVLGAPGKELVDFGLRRAHGAEAGELAARACYVAGFAGTSNVLAARRFGLPLSGTMVHSFVEACPSEEAAFLRFARANPHHVVLLIDTYDTLAATKTVIRLAPVLKEEGIQLQGVRIDSGDLSEQSRAVRHLLDEAGLRDVSIFVSGNLDETQISELFVRGAPIDGFGLGARLITSADAPYLDCAYKLQSYGGIPRCKLSPGKETWPGEKQVFRESTLTETLSDLIALSHEEGIGEPLLGCVMKGGRRTGPPPRLEAIRTRARRQLELLPLALQDPRRGGSYVVERSRGLVDLAQRFGVLPRGPDEPARHHSFGPPQDGAASAAGR